MTERIFRLLKDKLGDYFKYVAILLSALIITSLARNVLRIQRAGGGVEKAEKRVDKLVQEKEELEAKLEEVRSDEFIEKQLRDKLNLAKEDEIVIILPDDEILKKLAPKHEEEEEVLPDPNWKKWVHLFL